MRRRIYVDPESELQDHTLDAYLFGDDEEDFPPLGQPFSICDTGALHDLELWNKYQAACHTERVLRALVIEKLVAEPYDAVEIAAKAAFKEQHASDNHDQEAVENIRRALRDNAMEKYKP